MTILCGVNRIARRKPIDRQFVVLILEGRPGFACVRGFPLMLVSIPSCRGHLIEFRSKTVEDRILEPAVEAAAKLGFLQPRTGRSLSRLERCR
ncbi:hypothetical protein FB007_12824 [Sinorhizobium medicae]|nr:hypothetical protein FB007_12824 [Sinorhizobium medicae]